MPTTTQLLIDGCPGGPRVVGLRPVALLPPGLCGTLTASGTVVARLAGGAPCDAAGIVAAAQARGVGCDNGPLHLRLHLCGLEGGKGGFGANLRSQKTIVGQRKTTNFDHMRHISGRRLGDMNRDRVEAWEATRGARQREAARREAETAKMKIEEGKRLVIEQRVRNAESQIKRARNEAAASAAAGIKRKRSEKKAIEKPIGAAVPATAPSSSSSSSSSAASSSSLSSAKPAKPAAKSTSSAKSSSSPAKRAKTTATTPSPETAEKDGDALLDDLLNGF